MDGPADGVTDGDGRQPEAAAAHLSAGARAVLASPDLVVVPAHLRVVRARLRRKAVFFAVADARDRIQRKHLKGRFYEADELALIARHFPKGGVFCDVGANVGNHTLFALAVLGAARAIPFEPNPEAYEVMLVTLALNGLLDRADLGQLGHGVTDRDDAPPMAFARRAGNLGGTRLVGEGEGATVPVRRGDDLLAGRRIDFLKVDVEGMELEVLRGLSGTIAACRPPIFVEVEHDHRAALTDWAAAQGYRVAEEGRQFRHNGNLLLLPEGGTGPTD